MSASAAATPKKIPRVKQTPLRLPLPNNSTPAKKKSTTVATAAVATAAVDDDGDEPSDDKEQRVYPMLSYVATKSSRWYCTLCHDKAPADMEAAWSTFAKSTKTELTHTHTQ